MLRRDFHKTFGLFLFGGSLVKWPTKKIIINPTEQPTISKLEMARLYSLRERDFKEFKICIGTNRGVFEAPSIDHVIFDEANNRIILKAASIEINTCLTHERIMIFDHRERLIYNSLTVPAYWAAPGDQIDCTYSLCY